MSAHPWLCIRCCVAALRYLQRSFLRKRVSRLVTCCEQRRYLAIYAQPKLLESAKNHEKYCV
jgi:hypothetical protein